VIVKGEEVVALVDTGSTITRVLKALHDWIVHRLVNPRLEKLSVNIMGIASLRRKCKGRKYDIPMTIVEEDGIALDDRKIKPINEFPVPKNIKEIRSFLEMAGITKPITNLLKEKNTFECQVAFETLKQCLIAAPILGHPGL
jgi:hypothetical protein